MCDKKEFMKEAIRLAEYAVESNTGGPFGAVIVKNGKIIGIGNNQVIKTFDPTAHAEIQAIRNATSILKTFDLTGCEIYSNCEPCPMCLAACYWANIEKIYYVSTRKDAENIGFKDNFIYEDLGYPQNKPNKRLIKMELPEAEVVFKKWADKQDKVSY